MEKIIVLTGPTASGKTHVAISLAKNLNAEIISSDSMQIYRYMDIGTAKPSQVERQIIRHHLIDIKYPNEYFSSGEFVKLANKSMHEIQSRGKNVIIVGGGGFYLDSLIFGIDNVDNVSEKTKLFFDSICDEYSSNYLYRWLNVIDKKLADSIHSTDAQRIKRALSVYLDADNQLSDYFTYTRKIGKKFLIFVIDIDKEELFKNIERRTENMLSCGLIDEVKRLVNLGYINAKPLQSIGYKEVIDYMLGKISKNEIKNVISKNTKRYAKRQITYFKNKFQSAYWIKKTSVFNSIMNKVDSFA